MSRRGRHSHLASNTPTGALPQPWCLLHVPHLVCFSLPAQDTVEDLR